MPELSEHYRQLLVSHSKNPRHSKELAGDNIKFAELKNPLCNDNVKIYLRLEQNKIKDIGAISQGCAISTASASIMAQRVIGEDIEDVKQLYDIVRNLLIENKPPEKQIDLQEIDVIAEVKKFPLRIKCAMLPWRALLQALE